MTARTLALCVSLLLLALALPLTATQPAKPDDKVTLDPIMNRVKAWAADKQWQKKPFKDAELEKTLKALITQLGKAVGHEKMQYPLRLSGLKAAINAGQRGFLVLSEDQKFEKAEGGFIMIDGDLELTFANDCVILATGKVKISQGNRNFIIAGEEIEMGIANAHISEGKLPQGALIAGRKVSVGQAYHLICAANDQAKMQIAKYVVFVNTPTRDLLTQEGCRPVEDEKLDLRWSE